MNGSSSVGLISSRTGLVAKAIRKSLWVPSHLVLNLVMLWAEQYSLQAVE